MTARTLTSTMLAALVASITQPGFLVTVGFVSGTLHFCSRGAVTIGGVDYTGVDMEVSGLGADAKGDQKGTLRVGNTDSAIGAIVLNEQNADWPVTVWVYDAAAVGATDPVQIFEGTGNGAGGDERWTTIDLTSGKTSTQLVPSEYITAEQGFSYLPPAGMRIVTAAGIYILEPSRV